MPAKTKKEPIKKEESKKVTDDAEFEKALKNNEPKDKCFSQRPQKSK